MPTLSLPSTRTYWVTNDEFMHGGNISARLQLELASSAKAGAGVLGSAEVQLQVAVGERGEFSCTFVTKTDSRCRSQPPSLVPVQLVLMTWKQGKQRFNESRAFLLPASDLRSCPEERRSSGDDAPAAGGVAISCK